MTAFPSKAQPRLALIPMISLDSITGGQLFFSPCYYPADAERERGASLPHSVAALASEPEAILVPDEIALRRYHALHHGKKRARRSGYGEVSTLID